MSNKSESMEQLFLPFPNLQLQNTTSPSKPSPFEEGLVLVGLPSNLTPLDLLHRYQGLNIEKFKADQNYAIEEYKMHNTILKQQEEEVRNIRRSLQDRVNELTTELNQERISSASSAIVSHNLKNHILQYGQHTKDCNYVDMIETGKVGAKVKEVDLCDCGFTKLKQQIVGIIPEPISFIPPVDNEEDEL